MAQVQLTEQEIDILLECLTRRIVPRAESEIDPLVFSRKSAGERDILKKLWAARRELQAMDAAKEPTR